MKIINELPKLDLLESNRLVLEDNSKLSIAKGYFVMAIIILITTFYRNYIYHDHQYSLAIITVIITLLIIPVPYPTYLIVETDDVRWTFIHIRKVYFFNIVYKETIMNKPQVSIKVLRRNNLKLAKISFNDHNTDVSFKFNIKFLSDVKEYASLNTLDLQIRRG